MFKWLKQQGGVPGMASRNEEKAGLLYHAIDSSQGFTTARWKPRSARA